jgi:hypothetical protein
MQAPDFRFIPYSDDFSLRRDDVAKEVSGEIQQDRKCRFFTKWRQGFTPKEHREMLDRELRIKEERRWRIAEIILILVLSGLFTLLGAAISKGGL